LLLLNANDVPATKSIVRLSALEAESIVDFFLATMYGGQESAYTMNGNMIESSMIPGSTGISPSPTMIQQHQSELYSNGNGNGNMIAALRTHSSKFPVSIHNNRNLISSRRGTMNDSQSHLICRQDDRMLVMKMLIRQHGEGGETFACLRFYETEAEEERKSFSETINFNPIECAPQTCLVVFEEASSHYR
jgi:hypothetical protein